MEKLIDFGNLAQSEHVFSRVDNYLKLKKGFPLKTYEKLRNFKSELEKLTNISRFSKKMLPMKSRIGFRKKFKFSSNFSKFLN